MDFILNIDKELLSAIRNEIVASTGSQSSKFSKDVFVRSVTTVMRIASPDIDYQTACYDYRGRSLQSSAHVVGASNIHRNSIGGSMLLHHYQHFVRLISRIFDLCDIDGNRFLLWQDFTNFIVRTGRFALMATTRHVILSYMPSKVLWSYILPISRIMAIPLLDLLLTTDVNSTKLRMFSPDLQQYKVINLNKELAKLAAEKKLAVQSAMSKRAKYLQSKANFKSKFVLSPGATVTAMTVVDKRTSIIVCTSDCLIVNISYAEDMLDEFQVVAFEHTKEPQVL